MMLVVVIESSTYTCVELIPMMIVINSSADQFYFTYIKSFLIGIIIRFNADCTLISIPLHKC